MIDIAMILDGAVDLHVHSGPSPMPRRITHVEAARDAAQAGFRAIVVKCHYHDTVTDLLAMAPQLADLDVEVYGGIALNTVNGGLNPWAVDRSLRMGGRMIWFPTISSRAHLAHAASHSETRSHFQPLGMREQAEVSVFDDSGRVRPEVHDIVVQARDADAVISTGHLDGESALAVVRTATEAGHRRLVVSHPNYVTDIDRERLHEMIALGAVVEHEVVMYDLDNIFPPSVLVEQIRDLGVENCMLGSDLGQAGRQLPVEGYRSLLPRLADLGLTAEELRILVVGNPARVLGVDR